MSHPPSGGAGMHYGLLYQILSSLDRALTISMQRGIPEGETVTLIVEPRGGDVVEERSHERQVFQYKARSNRGAWSLNYVIDRVLPDLYIAVTNDDSKVKTTFRLVTEGHRGPWNTAWEFFRRLGDFPADALPVALDDVQKFRFFPRGMMTEREFFNDLVHRITKGHEKIDSATYRRVQLLLANFDIHQQPMASVQAQVNRALLGSVPYRERVPKVRRELLALLLEWGAEGNRRFTTEELLTAVGLSTTPLSLLPMLRDSLREQLDKRLRKAGYNRSKHVQRAISWPEEMRILCLSGESGMGKTLLLCQLADTAAETGPLVFIRPLRGTDDFVRATADEVWREILGNDESAPLDTLAKRATRFERGRPAVWLTVCLDVTAGDEQVAQILNMPWREWGIRLVFTADTTASKAIEALNRNDVLVHRVEEFTPRQIRNFFERRGIDWRQMPLFLIEPLRRHPILAHIYAEIDDIAAWQDTNEYNLFRRFWQRLQTAQGQSQHRNDTFKVLRLADAFVDDPTRYPWPGTVIGKIGVDDDARVRLERLSWLRNLEDGAAEFPHDRLLNWAVAEALIERLRSKRWSADDVGRSVAALASRPGAENLRLRLPSNGRGFAGDHFGSDARGDFNHHRSSGRDAAQPLFRSSPNHRP